MSGQVALEIRDCREQAALASDPYDRWVSPAGEATAEFYRADRDYLLRFPDQADFLIAADLKTVTCFPAPDMGPDALDTLYTNSVRPVIGNHSGELNLHGSAVVVDGKGLAIMGLSRRGKTTLAGAFARAGHPFLTEDVLALRQDGNAYSIAPQRPALRLFGDSANFLLGGAADDHCPGTKHELPASTALPAAGEAAPLAAICILGPGKADSVTLRPLGQADALAEILRHGFLLDIEDKARLHAHFGRVAQLAGEVVCWQLDYPREFAELPHVIRTVQTHLEDI